MSTLIASFYDCDYDACVIYVTLKFVVVPVLLWCLYIPMKENELT